MSKIIASNYNKTFGHRFEEKTFIKYFTADDFKGLKTIKIAFPSDMGQILRGAIYYYEKSNKLCVFCHGMYSNHHSYMHEIEYIAKSGQMVFAYDNTGVSESDGEQIAGVSQALVDLDYALRYIKESNYKDMKLSLVGHSMGGFAVTNILNFHDGIANVVGLAAPLCVKNVFKCKMNGITKMFLPFLMKIEKEKYPQYYDSSSLKALNNTNCRVLLIHSIDDKMVNCKKNTMFLQKKLSNSNIEYIYCNNKDHNPNYTENAVKYMKQVFESASKYTMFEELNNYFFTIDFKKMVEQDKKIMDAICNFIK